MELLEDRIWVLLARKLSGDISLSETEELAVLLKEKSEVHLKIQAISEFWDLNDVPSRRILEKKFEQHFPKLQQRSLNEPHLETDRSAFVHDRKKSKMLFVISVFVLFFVGCLTLLFLQQNKKESFSPVVKGIANTISTKYGSRTKVELPDGSTVWLNSGSKLVYNKYFGVKDREVYLTGEGFFNIVHNEDKPFIIHTAFFDIKDLGTQFNVKCYPDDKTTETSLVEGSVEIIVKTRPNEKWVLKPSEKLVLLNEAVTPIPLSAAKKIGIPKVMQEPIIALKKMTYLSEDSFALETAWAYNKLSFEDESFVDVAKKMERWYDATFEFKNKRLETIHISGSFISESLEQAMEALKYTTRFNYYIKERKVVIY